MCPNCTTVFIFRMWPNLGSGSKSELSARPALALEGKGGNHLRYSPLSLQNHLLGYLFGTLGPPWEAMSNTDPKKVKKILFQEAQMCPNCITVFVFRMWPNLVSGSKTALEAGLALALEGEGGNHLRYSPLPKSLGNYSKVAKSSIPSS